MRIAEEELSSVSARRAGLELALFALLAAGYLAVEQAGLPKRWLLPPVVLAAAAYLAVTVAGKRERAADFGLRFDNLLAAAVPQAVFTAIASAAMVALARVLERPVFRAELAILLPFYPLYGIVQQLVFQGVVQRRLRRLLRKPWLSACLAAALFSLVHLGDFRLVALTAAAGLFWSLAFLFRPNVIASGISHGLLASLAYPVFLGADPLKML